MAKFSKVDLSTMAPLVPINRDALSSLAKGEGYDFRPSVLHSRSPLPWRLSTERELDNPTWVELFGEVIGRLTVVGLYDGPQEVKKTRWVVKCVCGAYELRSPAFIKKCLDGRNPGDDEPMCSWCNHTNKLRKGHVRYAR